MTVSLPIPVARRAHLFRRLLRDPVAVGCLVVLAVVVLASLFAPLLTGHDPARSVLSDTLAPMSAKHPLGGDGVGRDVLARLLYGGRTSLLGGLIAVLVALLLGVPTGLVSGFYRGAFDATVSWLVSLVMAVPAIIVLLVVMAMVSQNVFVAMVVLGVIFWPAVYRLIRASVTSVREELYVDAARVSGLGDARIMRRHILPVVQAPSIIQAAQIFEVAIGIQAGLAFLGLGSANQASWGAMLNDAFTNIYTKPILLLWPGLAIGLTVVSLGLIGNALRDTVGGRSGSRASSSRTAAAAPAAPAAGPPPAGDDLLSVVNLRVCYPREGREVAVVDGVSLTVRRGEILGLVGESGSGKTQTAFALLGLMPALATLTADGLAFDGQDLRGLGRAARNSFRGRRIGYVPQEPMSNLDPSFRIGSQLVEPIRQHLKLSSRQARERALGLLERVGIADPARVFAAYPHQISGGMAQRVLIAGAVSCDPDLLIADEPTTALDVTVQAEVLDLMRSLQRERQMGMILVTHDLGVVADLCDRVAVMQTGQIIETAPAAQLVADPRHPYTRMLLDSTLEGAEPRSAVVAVPAPLEGIV